MSIHERVLRLFGWKVINKITDMPAKAIVISAPHTSNWDFYIGYFSFRALGIRSFFLIKEEAFFWPLAGLLRKSGGIPVFRGGKTSIVDDVAKRIKDSSEFILTITPEGQRTKQMKWKNGYHRIATAANVPVIIGYIDYKTKECGLLQTFELSNDFEKDTIEIMKFYKNMEGKHNDLFVLPPEVYE